MEDYITIIYATAILSNKSIVCRVWDVASINGWISRRKSCCEREFKDRTRALLCAVAVNTSTLTRAILKVQKLYVRPSFEYSTSGRAGMRPRALTHVKHPSRVCTCTRVHGHNSKIYVAYLRVRKARTFTGVREIIYSGIDFLASDALSCHSALTIHLQRPARLARSLAALISRNGERLADAFSANERQNDAALFRARENTTVQNY